MLAAKMSHLICSPPLPAASFSIPKPALNIPAFPAAPAATTRPVPIVVTRLSRTQSHADLVLYVL